MLRDVHGHRGAPATGCWQVEGNGPRRLAHGGSSPNRRQASMAAKTLASIGEKMVWCFCERTKGNVHVLKFGEKWCETQGKTRKPG